MVIFFRFPKDPEFPYELYELFKMDAMDDTEFKAEFRFRKTEVPLTTCTSTGYSPNVLLAIKVVRQFLELKLLKVSAGVLVR